ncbi:MAG: nucleotidyltransferase family protein, partial [Deltaproteobacteria bacterium]|nr:nucleotidyltransferase family protein [Deltaproteobacteria bacterium]
MPRFSPSPLETHLLRAALLEGEAADEAYRCWRGEVDLEAIDPASHPILPLLFRNLEARNIQDDASGILRSAYLNALYRNRLILHRGSGVLAALRERGVSPVVLKGGALLELYYR